MPTIIKTSILILVIMFFSAVASAKPIVCLQAISGEFCVTLEADIAPITVKNFLHYVNSGAYNNTFIHRSVKDFIIQGGGYTIDEKLSVSKITDNGTIQNEYNLSNIRGTIAMAKLGGDPNSATSEWFVNLNDNSANLNGQNGGFTVFGQVIEQDMSYIDQIAGLPTAQISGALAAVLTDTPLTGFTDGSELAFNNFIAFQSVKQVASYENGMLFGVVDAGSLGIFSIKLQLTRSSPYFFTLDSASLSSVSSSNSTDMTYDPQTGRLVINELRIDQTSKVHNVILELSDSTKFEFRLISIDGQNF